jgi:hypothetical protein
MSVYGYSIARGKVAFNIHLSSYQVSSFTGPLYNAVYNVDLRGHLDVSDFSKEYNVTFYLESEYISDGTIDPLTLYGCHVDIGNCPINAVAFRERATPHFIISKGFFNNAAGTLYTTLKAGSNDNPPIRINSAYGLDHIGINIFDVNGQATVNSTNAYQVILRFEEV